MLLAPYGGTVQGNQSEGACVQFTENLELVQGAFPLPKYTQELKQKDSVLGFSRVCLSDLFEFGQRLIDLAFAQQLFGRHGLILEQSGSTWLF
jgi:hypothetical protein